MIQGIINKSFINDKNQYFNDIVENFPYNRSSMFKKYVIFDIK